MKSVQKEKAIRLRKQGKTYSEILAEVPVAKSTLSEWLKSVQLASPQKQRLTEKRLRAARRGAEVRHRTRLQEIGAYVTNGKKEVGTLSAREQWLVGVALYWAEGSKQRDSSISTGLVFSNSDVHMIAVFLQWLRQLKIPEAYIQFELYAHELNRADARSFQVWWAKQLKIKQSRIARVYFKKGNPKTNRANTGNLYHGLLRIKVNSSTSLNRQVQGWVEGIVASLGSGVIGNTSAFEAEDSRIVA